MPNGSQAALSIDDDAELIALEQLLCNDDAATNTQRPCLREDSTFADAFSYSVDLPAEKLIVATKEVELDSSDDEEVKNFLEKKFNEYGCDINRKLKQQKNVAHDVKVTREVETSMKAAVSKPTSIGQFQSSNKPIARNAHMSSSFQTSPSPQARSATFQTNVTTATIFTDPVFGLRIINPLISSTLLIERMSGRNAVPFAGIAFHIQHGDLAKDWVIAGALVKKSPVRLSKKGDPFTIWSISDLRDEIKTVSIFLFGGAHKDLWKTAQGMCVAVLNPSVFEKRAQSKDVACLSIDTSQKVMILGQSKDLGVCKALKSNGDSCTSFINLSGGDVCIFHMKQEFSKMSRRSELQSANAGRGLNDLQNKILGKSEVFYGGKSYTAIPAKKSAKLLLKDRHRLSSLSEYATSPLAGSVNHISKPKSTFTSIPYAARNGPASKIADNVEVDAKQRVQDIKRLELLNADKSKLPNVDEEKSVSSSINTNPTRESLTCSENVPEKFKNREFSLTSSPQLSRKNFSIEVNFGVLNEHAQLAKLKAQKILERFPIKKVNPNSMRGSIEGKRRAIDELNEKFNTAAKRQKLDEEKRKEDHKSRIQRIMDTPSSHQDLIGIREQEEQNKYFTKLEKKEQLEEKMLNTYKMPCKAVKCHQCKYTAFSAAERCKNERHTLSYIDAEKRFFQCKDCGNRTATVFRLPKTSCKNCQGSRWQRTGMIRERKVCDGREELSLRGNEETFLGSLASKANLNLLVPDE